MEKTLLGLPLTADKVKIINEQHINTSKLIAEFGGFSLLNSTDELVGKALGANIEYLNMAGLSYMTDGVQ